MMLCFSTICKEDPDTKNSRSEIYNLERIKDLTYQIDAMEKRLAHIVSNFSTFDINYKQDREFFDTFVRSCNTNFQSLDDLQQQVAGLKGDSETIQKELKNYKKSLNTLGIQITQADSGVQKQFSSLEQRISVIEDRIKKMTTFAFNERIELLERVVPANQHACDRNQEHTTSMFLNVITIQSLILTVPAVYGIYAIFSSMLKKCFGCHDIYASSSRLGKIGKVMAMTLGFSAVSIGVYITLYKALLACTIGRMA